MATNFILEIEKESKGRSLGSMPKKMQQILITTFVLKGNSLILDPYYSVDLENKWRFPRVETIVRIPEGKVVVLDRETRDYSGRGSQCESPFRLEYGWKILENDRGRAGKNCRIISIILYICTRFSQPRLTRGVIGNTSDFGSEESRFEPWRVNKLKMKKLSQKGSFFCCHYV